MTALEQLEMRVNDVEITGLRLRHGMESTSWIVLVEIPGLGYIELDDKPDFNIEIKDPAVAKKQRTWKKVSLAELVTRLESIIGAMGA